MDIKIITSAQFDNYRRLKDKSISLRFITGEKTSHDVFNFDSLLDSFGYLYFKPQSQLTKNEITELDSLDTDLFDNPKTKSQRLRNTLYRNWEQENKKYDKFKDYYDQEMEIIITHFKNKLD